MIGLLYAFTSLSGEWLYTASQTASTSTEALALLERAAAVFPLDARFRRGPAQWLIVKRWHGSRPLAIAACRRLLATDPADADIRIGLAGLLIEEDDGPGARAELDIVHRITPSSPIRVRVNLNPATR